MKSLVPIPGMNSDSRIVIKHCCNQPPKTLLCQVYLAFVCWFIFSFTMEGAVQNAIEQHLMQAAKTGTFEHNLFKSTSYQQQMLQYLVGSVYIIDFKANHG